LSSNPDLGRNLVPGFCSACTSDQLSHVWYTDRVLGSSEGVDRTDCSPSHAEAKKMKSLILHIVLASGLAQGSSSCSLTTLCDNKDH